MYTLLGTVNRVVSTVDSLPSYSAANSFNGQITIADGLFGSV